MDFFGDDLLPAISLLSKGQKIGKRKMGRRMVWTLSSNGFKWFEPPVFGGDVFFVAATWGKVFLFALFVGRR